MPPRSDEVHPRMGNPHRHDGLLGGHERPVYNLRQPIHRKCVVASGTDLCQGSSLQRIYHTALFPRSRHRTKFARAQPARMLPRCERHHLHRTVHPHRNYPRHGWMGEGMPSCLDNHSVDTPIEYGTLRRPVDTLRNCPHLQSLLGRTCDSDCGRGSSWLAIQRKGQGHSTRRLQARRQTCALAGGCNSRRLRTCRPPLRAAHTLG